MIGRFATVDPIGKKYFSFSPFTYVLNNPLKYIDPTSMEVEDPDEIFKKQKQHLKSLLTYVNTQLKKMDYPKNWKVH